MPIGNRLQTEVSWSRGRSVHRRQRPRLVNGRLVSELTSDNWTLFRTGMELNTQHALDRGRLCQAFTMPYQLQSPKGRRNLRPATERLAYAVIHICTDPQCFRAKVDAHVSKMLETKPQLVQMSFVLGLAEMALHWERTVTWSLESRRPKPRHRFQACPSAEAMPKDDRSSFQSRRLRPFIV
jgi:hypothetical protein